MATPVNEIPIIDVLEKRKTLMSVRDVATVTGLSDKTIYRRVRSGTIPVVRFGYTVKFDPHQLAQWLRDHYAA